ncbi:ABC transporter permease [Isachenkonia alkalipeptolytica]|uniref:ABC transporter permease n=1 Tax=Isachenkonia alkalipeptolytica TaxID=2565777 RepID=A0AA44BD06_9CLOT|nr:ABC transporter permease [Isachenkonia alkalipeptolytica]NBG87448.1 ABC transporter permease [Isachenkonia alkalipeptolytica]
MKICTVGWLQIHGYFRKKLSWLLIILLPLGFSYFALGLFQGEAAGGKIPVVIVDEDQSAYSETLKELLREEPYLEVLERDLEAGLEDLRENRVEGVYRIQEGFEEEIQRDRTPELVSYTSSLAQGGGAVGEIVISRSIRILSSTRAANLIVAEAEDRGEVEDREALWEESFRQSESYWEPEPLMTLSMEEVLTESGEGNGEGSENGSPGTLGAAGFLTGPHGLLIIYSTLFSLWIFYKRREDISRGLYKRQGQIVGEISLYTGKFIGDFLFLSLHHGILLSSIYLFQGEALRGDLIHHVFLLLMVQVLFIGLWSFLSNLKMGKEFLVVGLPIGVLITSMVSGALWPAELLSEALQHIAMLFPQGIYMRGVGYSYIGATGALYTTMLWGIGIGCLLLWAGYRKQPQ